MASYQVGDSVKITGTFKIDNVVQDPTAVYLQIRDPSGNITTLSFADAEITQVSTGVYSYNLTLDEAGDWYVKFIGTGNVISSTKDTLIPVVGTSFTYPPT